MSRDLNDVAMTKVARDAAQGGGVPQGDYAVMFDPVTKTASPAANALMQFMQESVFKEIAPLQQTIKQLEAELSRERDKIAGTITDVVGTYLGEPPKSKQRGYETRDMRGQ